MATRRGPRWEKPRPKHLIKRSHKGFADSKNRQLFDIALTYANARGREFNAKRTRGVEQSLRIKRRQIKGTKRERRGNVRSLPPHVPLPLPHPTHDGEVTGDWDFRIHIYFFLYIITIIFPLLLLRLLLSHIFSWGRRDAIYGKKKDTSREIYSTYTGKKTRNR